MSPKQRQMLYIFTHSVTPLRSIKQPENERKKEKKKVQRVNQFKTIINYRHGNDNGEK